MAVGKKKSGFRFSKKSIKYIIFIVIASFILSGVFSGFSTNESELQNPEDESGLNWSGRMFESSIISDESGLVTIYSQKNELLIFAPNPSSIDKRYIDQVFKADVDGVLNREYELSPNNLIIRIQTDGRDIKEEFTFKAKLPKAWVLYDVYEGQMNVGFVDVVGEGLDVGDKVKVLLLSQTTKGMSESIALAQEKVVEGPILDAVVREVISQSIHVKDSKDLGQEKLDEVITDALEIQLMNEGNITEYNIRFDTEKDILTASKNLADAGFDVIRVIKEGKVSCADDMVIQNTLIPIPKSQGLVPATLLPNARFNESIRVQITPVHVGEQTFVLAMQVDMDEIERVAGEIEMDEALESDEMENIEPLSDESQPLNEVLVL